MVKEFKQLRVAIIGGGIGGMAAAVALRRSGHKVSIFERRDFDVEVGASISCAANGTQWLHEWDVDVSRGKPVVLQDLTMRDWEGKVLEEYDLRDYGDKWGNVYNMFHRQDMHYMLMEAATSPQGKGEPAELFIDYICDSVDPEKGKATFRNGKVVSADIIIGADGSRSNVRKSIGITPQITSAPQTCYRCNVMKNEVEKLGESWANHHAIQYWGGYPRVGLSQYYKIVMSPCRSGEVLSFYCFMPTELTSHHEEGFVFKEVPPSDIIVGAYDNLDPRVVHLIKNSIERKPWRLYNHKPYAYWYKGRTCILGDAAHPMNPHQSQGAVQAIEDAAALGIIFSSKYDFTEDVEAGLALYEKIRYGRASRVQEKSRLATENINERIGFSSLDAPDRIQRRDLAPGEGKLTMAELNMYDMHSHVAEVVVESFPKHSGYFGTFGGSYVPEQLKVCLSELSEAFRNATSDPEFWKELRSYYPYMGRPSSLHLADRLSEKMGGARIWLKREDLNHMGSHKINNALAQVLLAKRMGKTRVIAETGAGQHGVATATACAKFGLSCIVYMGAEDCRKQALNVFRMRLMGTEVVPVHRGGKSLADAVDAALEHWMVHLEDTFYVLGSVAGPHPYPLMVRAFQSVIGKEVRQQFSELSGKAFPDLVVACVGGGSNFSGIASEFVPYPAVKLLGVEAGGQGIESGRHAAAISAGKVGLLHGMMTFVLQDTEGVTQSTYSISSGLNYPGVGPEVAYWKESGRAEFIACTDLEALQGFRLLCETEGIIPAIESSHAIIKGAERAANLPKDSDVVINVSGRGDKDVEHVAQLLPSLGPKIGWDLRFEQ